MTSIASILMHSLEHHKAGRLKEAAAGYRQILEIDSQNGDALHLLGVLAQELGELDTAVDLITTAIGKNFSAAHYHHNLGNTYLRQNQPLKALDCYRQALLLRPAYPEALIEMGNALVRLQRLGDAEDAYQKAIRLQPRYAPVHANLGRVFSMQGRQQEAIAALREAVRLDRTAVDPLFDLGCVLAHEKSYQEAAYYFQLVLDREPNHVQALCNMGMIYSDLNDAQKSEHYLRQAISLRPDSVQPHFRLALLCNLQGRIEEAVSHYTKVLQLNPTMAEAYWALGNIQLNQDDAVSAMDLYCLALKYRPDYPECYKSLGNSLFQQNQFRAAAAAYQKAIALVPSYASAYCDLGIARMMLADDRAAELAFCTALEFRPDLPEAHYNLGNLYRNEFRFQEAMECYRRVLAASATKQQLAKSLGWHASNNLALCLHETGQTEEAIVLFREALLTDPENPKLHCNLGYALLMAGKLEEGWPEHEWRWKDPKFPTKPRNFGCPQWRGEPLNGATILLHAEQGLGDTLQFVRYVAEVVARGGKVILEVQPRLLRLLSRYPGVHQVLAQGEPVPAFSYHCPLLSLPLACGTTLESIPSYSSYLPASTSVVRPTRRSPDSPLRVGLAWYGNPENSLDAHRSMPLSELSELGDVANVSFFSLQRNEHGKELAEHDNRIALVDVCSQDRDLADTAEFIATLDLVITVDTAVAHLAAALGVPAWILLAKRRSDWRWFQNRNDSPWYPSVRLFRQSQPGEWSDAVRRVKKELVNLVEEKAHFS